MSKDKLRKSKRHIQGIVLEGEYKKKDLEEFMDKHKKRTVLYIGKGAFFTTQNIDLPTGVKAVKLYGTNYTKDALEKRITNENIIIE